MARLLIRPHSVIVSAWPDHARHLDTPETNASLAAYLPAGHGVAYSAFLPRETPPDVRHGVAILDWECGVLYELLADRKDGVPVLLRKTVVPMGLDTLADVATLPDALLATLAVDYLENRPDDEPFEGTERDSDEADARRKIRPGLHRIATLVNDQARAHQAARSSALTRAQLAELVPRKWLAARFGVNVQTADRWIAQARAAGLVPPATVAPGSAGRGRPRKHATTAKAGA